MIYARPGLAPPPVPALETERLVLRAYRRADLGPAAAMWGDERVVRHIGGDPRPRGDVWNQMQRMIGSWALLGYGYWVVERRDTGAFIGEAGFMEALREIDPPLEGRPEAGWGFSPAVWGLGYASEAVAAIVGWADEALAGETLSCMIDPANAASLRVAEKAGFQEVSRTAYAGEPILVFQRRAGV